MIKKRCRIQLFLFCVILCLIIVVGGNTTLWAEPSENDEIEDQPPPRELISEAEAPPLIIPEMWERMTPEEKMKAIGAALEFIIEGGFNLDSDDEKEGTMPEVPVPAVPEGFDGIPDLWEDLLEEEKDPDAYGTPPGPGQLAIIADSPAANALAPVIGENEAMAMLYKFKMGAGPADAATIKSIEIRRDGLSKNTDFTDVKLWDSSTNNGISRGSNTYYITSDGQQKPFPDFDFGTSVKFIDIKLAVDDDHPKVYYYDSSGHIISVSIKDASYLSWYGNAGTTAVAGTFPVTGNTVNIEAGALSVSRSSNTPAANVLAPAIGTNKATLAKFEIEAGTAIEDTKLTKIRLCDSNKNADFTNVKLWDSNTNIGSVTASGSFPIPGSTMTVGDISPGPNIYYITSDGQKKPFPDYDYNLGTIGGKFVDIKLDDGDPGVYYYDPSGYRKPFPDYNYHFGTTSIKFIGIELDDGGSSVYYIGSNGHKTPVSPNAFSFNSWYGYDKAGTTAATGTFPVAGNTVSIKAGSLTVGLASDTPSADTNIDSVLGSTDVETMQFDVKAGSAEDLRVEFLKITTDTNQDISNVKLYRDGTLIGNATPGLGDGMYDVNLRNPVTVPAGGIVNFTLRGDVSGSDHSDTVSMGGYSDTAVAGTFPVTDNTVSVKAGSLSVSRNSDTPIADATGSILGNAEIEMGRFNLRADSVEDVKIRTLEITTGDSEDIKLGNVKVTVGGETVGNATVSATGNTAQVSFGDGITVPANSTVTVDVTADIPSSTSGPAGGSNVEIRPTMTGFTGFTGAVEMVQLNPGNTDAVAGSGSGVTNVTATTGSSTPTIEVPAHIEARSDGNYYCRETGVRVDPATWLPITTSSTATVDNAVGSGGVGANSTSMTVEMSTNATTTDNVSTGIVSEGDVSATAMPGDNRFDGEDSSPGGGSPSTGGPDYGTGAGTTTGNIDDNNWSLDVPGGSAGPSTPAGSGDSGPGLFNVENWRRDADGRTVIPLSPETTPLTGTDATSVDCTKEVSHDMAADSGGMQDR